MNNDSYFDLRIYKGFYKVDEDYKILGDQTFVITGIDNDQNINDFTFTTMYDGMYFLDDYLYSTYGEIGHLLPNILVERLEQLKTESDVLNLVDELGIDYNYNYDYISVPFPIKIKQVNADEYISNDLIYFLNGKIHFYYDDYMNIEDMAFTFNGYNENDMIRNDNFSGINSLSDLFKYQQDFAMIPDGEVTCINQSSADGKIISDASWNVCQNGIHNYDDRSGAYKLVNYFVDYRKEAELEIENTVNDVTEYVSNNNKELNYKITVKNIGESSSFNNVVVTEVPEELIVNEKSISDDGDYDKIDDFITWKMDSLDAGEKYTFTYSATISDKADKSKIYIGKSKVFSNQSEIVHSNETKVYLSKSAEVIDRNNMTNPNTYSTAVFGIVTLILVCLVIGTYFVKKKESLK